MRLVVAGLAVAAVTALGLTAYLAADASVQAATAPQLTDDYTASIQSVALAKADRLFVFRVPQSGSEIVEDATAPDEQKPDLTIGEFCEALTQAAEAAALPPAFFARLIWQESKFRADARSHVGAQGVAQFMPATATEVGLVDPFDPRQALPASAKFLRRLHDQFGNLGLAAAAYNAGPGRIQNWLARRGRLPDETRNYVRTITGNPAESWTSERKTVGLHQQLPNRAPCEGIGGLSRDKENAAMPVALTPAISDLVRRARIEAARAAAAAKARLAALKASKRKAVKVIVARNDSRIRLASAAK